MRNGEARQGADAVRLTSAALLGGLLALGIALMVLLLGAVAVSNGVLKESATVQVTAAACTLGCFVGGLLTCARWRSKKLLAGLAAGGVCYLLILAVGLITTDGAELGIQALIELACCLCGGALSALVGVPGKNRKRSGGSRKKR